MNICEWTASVNAIAIALSKGKSIEELIFLSRSLSLLASSLSLLATPPQGNEKDILEDL